MKIRETNQSEEKKLKKDYEQIVDVVDSAHKRAIEYIEKSFDRKSNIKLTI